MAWYVAPHCVYSINTYLGDLPMAVMLISDCLFCHHLCLYLAGLPLLPKQLIAFARGVCLRACIALKLRHTAANSVVATMTVCLQACHDAKSLCRPMYIWAQYDVLLSDVT